MKIYFKRERGESRTPIVNQAPKTDTQVKAEAAVEIVGKVGAVAAIAFWLNFVKHVYDKTVSKM